MGYKKKFILLKINFKHNLKKNKNKKIRVKYS